MRTSIERLRAGVVAVAALVTLVVAGFLVYAHRQTHRWLGDLPARLGAEIQKETNGFTFSQSVKGRTVFSIHAATATQRKDGQTQLHDVRIVLFGKDGQSDRIAGKDFTYDQRTGVVRAMGQVELDLQAPGQASVGASREPVHVVTSGLVYLQKLGVASTAEPIQFEFEGVSGDAKGASFNTDTGVTTLESDVRVRTTEAGRPAVLTAGHAELNRPMHRLELRSGLYATGGGRQGSGEGERLSAGRLELALTEAGAVQGGVASDGVAVVAQGSSARSPDATLTMGAQGRPESVRMTGGVTFRHDEVRGDGAADVGQAEVATGRFGAAGLLGRVELAGQVRVQSADQQGGHRELLARDAVLVFGAGGAANKPVLERMEATGSAQLLLTAVGKAGPVREEMQADRLVARLGAGGAEGSRQLDRLTGAGHTMLRRSDALYDEVSRGDTVDVRFGPETREAGGSRGERTGVARVVSAVQRGSVELERRDAPGHDSAGGVAMTGTRAQGGPEHASGAELVYDGVAGSETLRGGAKVWDADGTVQAAEMTTDEASGDAVATGDVAVTYRSQPGKASGAPVAEPVHVLSGRAVLHRAAGTAEFRLGGDGQRRPRMWQGGSLLEAPVLLLSQAAGTLEARSDAHGAGGALEVTTVLSSQGGQQSTETQERKTSSEPARRGVTRIQSGSLRYDDRARTADFLGGVRIEDGGSTVKSQQATAIFKPRAGPAAANGAAPAMSGELERVVATGDVVIRQPGRTAAGAKAVYTPADQVAVLTGLPGSPPRVVDLVQGSVTGDALRFRAGDNSVMVEGRGKTGELQSGDGRVHTRTRVRQTE